MKIRQVPFNAKRFTVIAILLGVAAVGFGVWYVRETRNMLNREFDSQSIESEARPRLDQIRGIKSRAEMEAWITGSESQVARELAFRGAGIKKDQRKSVAWAQGTKFKTPISIVYIHGFSASRLELDPVISEIAGELKANVFYTRLKGHGITDGEDFVTVRARDWAVDVEEALAVGRTIGDRVVIIAMSTGAALALENVVRHLKDAEDGIAGLVLLSPNYAVRARGSSLLEGPFGRAIARIMVGSHREFKTENAMHAERWTPRYRIEGLTAMIAVAARSRELDLSKIKIPALTVYTNRDDVVDTSEINRRSGEFKAAGSTTREWELGQRHELASATFDSEHAEALAELISNWIKQTLDVEAPGPAAENPK